jgi:hypothetical protein
LAVNESVLGRSLWLRRFRVTGLKDLSFQGASYLSQAILDKYGKDSIAFLVDEGFGGVDVAYGRTFASLGMAEKGNVDLVVSIE